MKTQNTWQLTCIYRESSTVDFMSCGFQSNGTSNSFGRTGDFQVPFGPPRFRERDCMIPAPLSQRNFSRESINNSRSRSGGRSSSA